MKGIGWILGIGGVVATGALVVKFRPGWLGITPTPAPAKTNAAPAPAPVKPAAPAPAAPRSPLAHVPPIKPPVDVAAAVAAAQTAATATRAAVGPMPEGFTPPRGASATKGIEDLGQGVIAAQVDDPAVQPAEGDAKA